MTYVKSDPQETRVLAVFGKLMGNPTAKAEGLRAAASLSDEEMQMLVSMLSADQARPRKSPGRKQPETPAGGRLRPPGVAI